MQKLGIFKNIWKVARPASTFCERIERPASCAAKPCNKKCPPSSHKNSAISYEASARNSDHRVTYPPPQGAKRRAPKTYNLVVLQWGGRAFVVLVLVARKHRMRN